MALWRKSGKSVSAYLKKNRYIGEYERSPLISFRNRIVFFPIGKVANSSLKSLLFKAELSDTRVAPNKFSHSAIESPFILPYQLPDKQLDEILADPTFRKIVFVRNPYSRLLSCFLDRVQKPRTIAHKVVANYLAQRGESMDSLDFERFVRALPELLQEDQHWRPQAIECAIDYIDFDLVGRFESLEADARRMMKTFYPDFRENLGFDSPAKTGSGSRLLEYYAPDIADIVAQCYEADFRHFSYDRALPAFVEATA